MTTVRGRAANATDAPSEDRARQGRQKSGESLWVGAIIMTESYEPRE